MKLFMRSVLFLSFVAVTTQDVAGRKGCDCSICKGVNNKINPIVGKRIGHGDEGKSGCNICEKRKEMLRLEREKQRQLQKCPFDILGRAPIKGKTSEEIFDEFRELIVPSQNGFFDMMRGVVRTMHVSSETELKWAKEKEARELAKKKKEEAEAKKRKALQPAKDEIVRLDNPVNPKVTVVLKQTPCGQILQPSEASKPEKVSLMQRFPKEANSEMFRTPEDLQSIDQMELDYVELKPKENLQSDLIDQLVGYNVLPTTAGENSDGSIGKPEDIFRYEEQTMKESPFLKFIRSEEFKTMRGRNSLDGVDTGLELPKGSGVESQRVDKENAHSVEPVSV